MQLILIVTILLAAWPTLPLKAEQPPAFQRPNVLFILADDLGYGDLSCYGATKVATPNIDRLAAEGRRFTDAHSPSSVCTPSRYNLLSGRYAWRTWAKTGTVWANDPLLIEEDRFTLADLFKQQGYATGGNIGDTRAHDPSQPPGQLYHLGRDPAESKNEYARRPGLVAELSHLLKTYQDSGRSAPVATVN